MVRMLLNRQDIMNVMVWGAAYKGTAENVGVPFDNDEIETLEKFKEVRNSYRTPYYYKNPTTISAQEGSER